MLLVQHVYWKADQKDSSGDMDEYDYALHDRVFLDQWYFRGSSFNFPEAFWGVRFYWFKESAFYLYTHELYRIDHSVILGVH